MLLKSEDAIERYILQFLMLHTPKNTQILKFHQSTCILLLFEVFVVLFVECRRLVLYYTQ